MRETDTTVLLSLPAYNTNPEVTMFHHISKSLLTLTLLCSPLLAVDGIAVSVCWQYVHWNYAGDATKLPGTKLVRFDIVDNKPVSSDTLYHHRCAYPAIDVNGRTIAFYADDEQGKHWIATMDIDGSNLKKLVEIENYGEAAHLDWEKSTHIVYERPDESTHKSFRGSGEIWKINPSNPSENVKLWDYTRIDTGKDWVRRFSLSADGKRAGCQIRGENTSQFIHTVSSNPFNSKLGSEPACNLSISTSGDYFAVYRWGAHADLFLFHYDDASGKVKDLRDTYGLPNIHDEIATSLGFDPGRGCEVIRWSANSDKWVLQCVGRHGHADRIRYGSNPVIYNWIDDQAIMPSRNAKLPCCDLAQAETTAYFNNTTGDFYVKGIPAVHIETVEGEYVKVADGVSVERNMATLAHRPRMLPVRRVFVQGPHAGVRLVDERNRVVSLTGRVVLEISK